MLLLLALSCAPKPAEPLPAAPVAAPPAPVPAYARAMLDAMDTTADPCQDFYQYACGNWVKNTALPADKPIWARSFSVIREENLTAERELLEAAAKGTPTDPDQARLGNFYGACMDEAAVDAKGMAPIQPLLGEIAAVKDLKGFAVVSGKLSALGVNGLATAWVDGDYKDPATSILYLSQGGLSLPDRDYYLVKDEGNAALLKKLEATVAAQLGRAGVKDAATLAPQVVAFEAAIAEAQVPRADLRDPDKTYHKIDRAGLVKTAPDLSWDLWLDAAGGKGLTAISVETPEVYTKYGALVKKTPLPVLKAWASYATIARFSGALDSATFTTNFELARAITGQKEPEARWKRCVRATDTALGEAVGKAWVEKRFAGDSKQIALGTIGEIERAFEAGLPGLAWMDDPTRARAVDKVKAILNKIGYPDVWRDYSALQVAPGTHFENVVAATRFENDRQLAKVGKPADRAEWYMTPPTVNAYYNATINEMVFPAGILQPPFFSRDFPSAMNYGAIGMVMGHELTHGFDDQGRKFDPQGKLSEWWTPEVSTRYEERAACVEKQYSGYEVQPGLKVNGTLTLGENIADLGGLKLSHRAFKANKNPVASAVPGLTEDQVFFLAFAQGWCNVAAPEFQKVLVLSDSHSPGRFRVNGPVSNTPAFGEAFSCAAGTPMRPTSTCEVW